MNNQQIEQIASKTRALVDGHAHIRNRFLLRNLVERLGGTIRLVEDPTEQEIDGGSLIIDGKKKFTIFLSPFTTPLRDNFTIAHELGHYVLHYLLIPNSKSPLCFTRYGSGPIEWQANRFAASLLMPQSIFTEAYGKYRGNISLLSGYFDVSSKAVEIRVQSLRLDGSQTCHEIILASEDNPPLAVCAAVLRGVRARKLAEESRERILQAD